MTIRRRRLSQTAMYLPRSKRGQACGSHRALMIVSALCVLLSTMMLCRVLSTKVGMTHRVADFDVRMLVSWTVDPWLGADWEFKRAKKPSMKIIPSTDADYPHFEAKSHAEESVPWRASTRLPGGRSESRGRILLQSGSNFSSVQTILVVSHEGLPNHFPTVQAAVDAVPMWNVDSWVIYIRPGVYNESIVIPQGKNNITLVGVDSANTTLSCNKTARDFPRGILDSACVVVEGAYFRAENITFENTTPKPDITDHDGQGSAIRVSADNASFFGCAFLGWQDTLFADQGRHYLERCRIEGNVDFILGYARALFNSCTIVSRAPGYVTAQSRWCDKGCVASNSAFVFVKCNLTGSGPTYLGRPWRPFAKVVFVDTWMDGHIVAQGWNEWLEGDWPYEKPLFPHTRVYFAESNSSGPGANPAGRVLWSHQIQDSEVQTHSYRDPITFLNGQSWIWRPALLYDLPDLLRRISKLQITEDFTQKLVN